MKMTRPVCRYTNDSYVILLYTEESTGRGQKELVSTPIVSVAANGEFYRDGDVHYAELWT
jgi:hypothetical protein